MNENFKFRTFFCQILCVVSISCEMVKTCLLHAKSKSLIISFLRTNWHSKSKHGKQSMFCLIFYRVFWRILLVCIVQILFFSWVSLCGLFSYFPAKSNQIGNQIILKKWFSNVLHTKKGKRNTTLWPELPSFIQKLFYSFLL